MRKTAIAMALVSSLSACADVTPEGGLETDPAVRAAAIPEESGDLWVTIGMDAVGAVREALDNGTIVGAIESEDASEQAAIVRLRRNDAPELTRLMHDKFNRCGGYVAHDSFDLALARLDKERDAAFGQKILVNYTIDNGAVVQEMLPDLQAANIASTISMLSSFTNRYYTTQTGVNAAHAIRDLWTSYAQGRSDVTVELFQHPSYPQPSVILTITGDTFPDEVVVLGGHLDSTAGFAPGPSTVAPGADDDASGIATLSEVIRVALASGFKPDRTVKFMAYAAEEVGLRGSGEIADAYQAQGINVIGAMQLDMTNYAGSTQIVLISDHTNAAQNTFVGNLINTYLGFSWTFNTCGYACSDHASWNSNGVPASFPFEALFNSYNPYIHTASDTLANSGGNANHALKFAKIAVAYLAELAKGGLDGDPSEPPPPPPPPPEPTTQTFSGSVLRNENDHFGPFAVQSGSMFTAQITGSGDADLYVRFGAPPTTTTYNCRPFRNGSNETCSLAVPAGQNLAYVMVRGYSSATYNLTVTFFPQVRLTAR